MRSFLVALAVLYSAAHADPVRVIARWPKTTISRLLGVTREGTAIVWREGPGFGIDEIDGKSGKRSQWNAGAEQSRIWLRAGSYNDFQPIAGDLAGDLARFAGLIERTGPWGTRVGRPLPVMSDGKSLFFGHGTGLPGSEHWYLANPDASHGRRLDADSAPKISPDGKTIAFTKIVAEGVCLEEAKSGAERRCPKGLPDEKVKSVRSLLWSSEGRWLYAHLPDCLYRLDAQKADAKWEPLRCGRFAFAPAPDVKSALWVGESEIERIELPSGQRRGATEGFPQMGWPSDEHFFADESGRLAALDDAQRSLFLIDLAGHRTELAAEDGYFEGLRATRWERGTFLVVRRAGDEDQLIRVDANAILR